MFLTHVIIHSMRLILRINPSILYNSLRPVLSAHKLSFFIKYANNDLLLAERIATKMGAFSRSMRACAVDFSSGMRVGNGIGKRTDRDKHKRWNSYRFITRQCSSAELSYPFTTFSYQPAAAAQMASVTRRKLEIKAAIQPDSGIYLLRLIILPRLFNDSWGRIDERSLKRLPCWTGMVRGFQIFGVRNYDYYTFFIFILLVKK